MAVSAFELNLITNEVTPSDPDPTNVYASSCLHVQYDDGELRVYGERDGSIRLCGKAAVNSADRIYRAGGDVPWQRIATALSTILSSPELPDRRISVEDGLSSTRLTEEGVVADHGFITFDLDTTTGATWKVSTSREQALRARTSARTWQVVLVGTTVRVFGLVDHRIVLIGRAVRRAATLEHTSTAHPALSNDHQWRVVEKAMAHARAQAHVRLDEKPRPPIEMTGGVHGMRSPNTAIVYPPPTRGITKRHYLVTSVGVFVFAGLVYAMVRASKLVDELPLWGGHVVFAPLAMLIAPISIVAGILVLSSRHAIEDNERRRATGRVHPGPLAAKGIALLFLGSLLAVYPLVMLRFAQHFEPDAATRIAQTALPTPPPPPRAATPDASHAGPPIPTLAETLARVEPQLGDGARNRGAWELARYASQHLAWRDVIVTDVETTIPLVLKDSDLERGKRLCATGSLADIEREDLDRRPVFVGVLRTADGDDVHFIAVGSSGSLVKRSTATVCGIVTGRAQKAVVLVGMFDLPENAQPAVER